MLPCVFHCMNLRQIPCRNFNPMKNTGLEGKAHFAYMAVNEILIFSDIVHLIVIEFHTNVSWVKSLI